MKTHITTTNQLKFSLAKIRNISLLAILFLFSPGIYADLCTGVIIDDGDPCTIDACDPQTGIVSNTSSNFGGGVLSDFFIDCYGGTTPVQIFATGGVTPYTGVGNFNYPAGLHTITVTDALGCILTGDIPFNESPMLTATTSSSPEICGSSDGIAAVLVGGGQPTYHYDWRNASNIQVSTTFDAAAIPAGIYTVLITDDLGCTKTETVTVGSGGNPPNAPATISGPPGVCKGQTVMYCVPADPAATGYVWSLPSGATGSSTTNCINVRFNSKYAGGLICVRAVNNCGNSLAVCINAPLEISKPSEPSPINWVTSICANNTVTFCVSSIPNAASYIWTIGGNSAVTISNGQGTTCITVNIPANAIGTFDVKVKAQNCKGTGDERKAKITIKSFPGMPSTITGPASVCKSQLGFYNVTNVTGVAYNWTITGNVWIAGGQGLNYLALDFSTSNTNTAVLSVTASNGCGISAPRIKDITINPNCRIGNFDEVVSSTNNYDLKLYPNPANYEINIDFISQSDSKYALSVYDMTGRILKEINFTSVNGENHQLVNLAEFSKGTYFMQLISEEGTTVKKFVVE